MLLVKVLWFNTTLQNLNFHQLEVVTHYREPQLQLPILTSEVDPHTERVKYFYLS